MRHERIARFPRHLVTKSRVAAAQSVIAAIPGATGQSVALMASGLQLPAPTGTA
jgi:hypothetical protein